MILSILTDTVIFSILRRHLIRSDWFNYFVVGRIANSARGEIYWISIIRCFNGHRESWQSTFNSPVVMTSGIMCSSRRKGRTSIYRITEYHSRMAFKIMQNAMLTWQMVQWLSVEHFSFLYPIILSIFKLLFSSFRGIIQVYFKFTIQKNFFCKICKGGS